MIEYFYEFDLNDEQIILNVVVFSYQVNMCFGIQVLTCLERPWSDIVVDIYAMAHLLKEVFIMTCGHLSMSFFYIFYFIYTNQLPRGMPAVEKGQVFNTGPYRESR